MDANFWLQKWEKNEIAFHNRESHPMLVKYFNMLSPLENSRVFLPLCGKTLDIAWLLSQGYRIAGAELSKIAIEQLFLELGVKPNVLEVGEFAHYNAQNIDLFVGDIFHLSREILGPVDAIYDRAALVALPGDVRDRYTSHLMEITSQAPQLLICYEYDQSLMGGPPFSICAEMVNQYYGDRYRLTLLESTDVPKAFKGKCSARENVWLLGNN